MLDPISCQTCGKQFVPRNRSAKYCCKKCRWTAGNAKRSKKTERSCRGCGDDISAMDARAVYCSNTCRRWVANGNDKLRTVNTHCLRCGRKFDNLRPGKKWCGQVCKNEASHDKDPDHYARRYQRERDHRLAYALAYNKANPEVGQATKRRRKALMQANGVYRFNGADWKRCCNMYDNRCVYCGERGPLTMDHVIPVTRGGTHSVGNIVPACARCNSMKRTRFVMEWKLGRSVKTPAA